MLRRHFLNHCHRLTGLAAGLAAPGMGFAVGEMREGTEKTIQQRQPDYPAVVHGHNIQFPRDHGSHPDYRTEWWYLTAWLTTPEGPAGLQVTFFRSRTTHGRRNPSTLAARQLLFAHAAIAWPASARLLHDQLATRAMPEMISDKDTHLRMGSTAQPWSMVRSADDHYQVRVRSDQFDIDVLLKPPAAPVLQGDNGYSRKGPDQLQASYYYSRPQLTLTGQLNIRPDSSARTTLDVHGTGWLDHEWSSQLLHADATGWDWIGINLTNGDALMAFRIRGIGGRTLWSHARWIRKGQTHSATPAQNPVFTPIRSWESGRTGTRYPVQMRVQIGDFIVRLDPLLDDQELDSRRSTGILYWEGAVSAVALSGESSGQTIGHGYLELTGYSGKIRL